MSVPLWALVFGLSVISCAPVVQHAPSPGSSTAGLRESFSDRLYFGRSIPGGGTVSEADWISFLREVITPRFPAGLTAWRADGQWQDSSRAVRHEESFVLELIHPADRRSEIAIQEIVGEYKRRFRQEAVLRVQGRVQVSY